LVSTLAKEDKIMRSRPLSASSIKTFLQCSLKYYYRYEDKKPRLGKTDPLAFGIAVHEALEFIHQKVSDTGKPPGPQEYNEALSVFMQSATRSGLSDLKLYQEGKDLITKRLDNIDPEEKVIGLELSFELKTPKGTPFLGSIDKLIELDPETVVIIDYKTSRVALSQAEADHDIQLSMYDLAVSMMFPQYKTIICGLDYLRLSEVMTYRTPEQRALFVDFLDAVYEQICAAEEDDVSANINSFCSWCDFKSFCPEYVKVVEDPGLLLPPPGELGDHDFVNTWELLAAAKKTIEGRYRELKAELHERMREKGVVSGDGKELYKVQSSRVTYDPRTVLDVVGVDKFIKMVSVNKMSVDRYLKDNPEKAKEVDKTAQFAFSSPSFRIRKIKQD